MSAARDMLADTARAVFAEAATEGIAPVEEAGFALLLVPEERGGFGGDWGDVNAVLQIAGVVVPDLPIAELMLPAADDALLAAATVSLMAGAMEVRLRLSGSRGFMKPPGRSMRITSAPWSASIMPQKGPGPIPANSMIRMPLSGPVMSASP